MADALRPVIGWDTESYPFSDEVPVPDGVCLSAAGGSDTLTALVEWDASLAVLFEAELARPRVLTGPTLWARSRVVDHDVEWELLIPFDRALDLLLHLLLATDAVIVAHFEAYDWSVVLRDRPDLLDLHAALMEQGRLADTSIREQLWAIATDNFKFDQRTRRPGVFSLAAIVLARFGVDLSGAKKGADSWRLRYGELDGVPLDLWPEAAVTYAVEDAVWARRIYLDQTPLELSAGTVIREDGTVVNEREQAAFDWVLRKMATYGVRTDGPAVEAFAVEVSAMVDEAEVAGAKAGFIVVNCCKACLGTGWHGEVSLGPLTVCPICEGLDHDTMVATGRYGSYKNGKPHTPAPPKTKKSMARLQDLVLLAYGGNPPLTETGRVSTDVDTLNGSTHPALIEYAKGSFATKLRDTYLPVLRRGVQFPIYSDPRVLVRSGRTSWSDPNFQNPPQRGGFRECFIPREGMVFASIDYQMLEMCTLAQVNLKMFGYSRMAEAINAGRDLHSDFGAQLMHMAYEDVERARKSKADPLHVAAKNARDRAKAANFSFLGGLGAVAFMEYAKGYGVSIDLNEAEDLKAAWLARWEEMKDYFKWIGGKGGFNERFELRQHGSGRVRGGCTFTSGANTMFQGLAADGAKCAGWSLYKDCYVNDTPLRGVHMWAFVHDEFLFEGPEDTAHLWAPYATEVMIRDMSRYTPDVTVRAEPALMRRWSKSAETKYLVGADGTKKLVPWEDAT